MEQLQKDQVADAIATLRRYALTGQGSESALGWAIDTIDNADLFVGHDGES